MADDLSPFLTPEAYDTLTITIDGATGSPWTWVTWVEVEGVPSNEWDDKKAGGQDGAAAADKGYRLARPKLRWILHTHEQWVAFQQMIKAARPRPGKKTKPTLRVTYPLLADYELRNFVVEGTPIAKFLEVDQWEAQLELLEQGTPKKAKTKPKPKDDAEKEPTNIVNGYYTETQKGAWRDTGDGPMRPPSLDVVNPPPKRFRP